MFAFESPSTAATAVDVSPHIGHPFIQLNLEPAATHFLWFVSSAFDVYGSAT